MCVGGGADGQGERIPRRLQAELGAQCGARFQDPEIMTRAEIKGRTLNPLTHPGVPTNSSFLNLSRSVQCGFAGTGTWSR